MLVWTTGMPLFAFIFFAIVFLLIVGGVFRAIRCWTWDDEPPSRGMQASGPRASDGFEFGRWQCGLTNCRAYNPPHARFCRMCGKPRPHDPSDPAGQAFESQWPSDPSGFSNNRTIPR